MLLGKVIEQRVCILLQVPVTRTGDCWAVRWVFLPSPTQPRGNSPGWVSCQQLIRGERLCVLFPFPAAPSPFFEGLNPGGGRRGEEGL